MKSALLLSACLFACTSEENLGDSNPGDTVTSTARWAITLGERGYETADAVAVDSHGDVIVAGTGSLAAADLGNGTIGNDSMYGWGYLTKRSGVDGSPLWTIPYAGDSSSANIADIAIGSDDTIIIAGGYSGTLSFSAGSPPIGPGGGMFVAKYASDGTLVWIEMLGAGVATAVGIDNAGNIFVSGNNNYGSFDFMGTHHAVTDSSNYASYVVSYTPDGTPRWGNFFDPPAASLIQGLAVSTTGDIVITGEFSTTLPIGGQLMNPNARQRGFIARYHGDGSYMWSGPVGPSASDDTSETDMGSVTIDALDRIIFQGNEAETYEYVNASPTLHVLEPNGASAWTYSHHYPDSSVPLGGLSARSDGTVVNSTWLDAPYNADHPDQVPGSLELRLFDMDGNVKTSSIGKRLLAGGRLTAIHDSAIGPSGELAVVGDLGGEVLIGQGAIESHGTNDSDGLVILIEP